MSTYRQESRFLIGNQDAQRAFAKRYQKFLEEYPKVRDAQDKVIAASSKKMRNNIQDKGIYLLARQVYEDFDEILVLCANGLSTGGMKILRGMFERTVTVCYLQKHLEEVEVYFKYFYVRRRKEANAIKPEFPNVLPPEFLETIEREYDEVKSLFQVPVCEVCRVDTCKACKKKRDNFSWIRKDIVQMARETGDFGAVIYFGYYVPMQETHPTSQAVTHRIRATSNGKWEYFEGPKPDLDDRDLMVAHFLVIRAVEVLGLHFSIRIKGLLGKRWDEFVRIWGLKKRRGQKGK
jgi:Family of unknown function (DUF5677)